MTGDVSRFQGMYHGVEVKGHAGYDEYGKDIVCALYPF
ncbi:ribosomal-processing cysteine protease Prp [Clostridium fessum]